MPTIVKILLIFLGIIFMGIVYAGILVPGLPTTPFLLLSAGCFIRSSQKLYTSLINNRLFGTYIKNFHEQKAMTRTSKKYAIALMWIMILISVLLIIKNIYLKILILVIGLIGSFFMGRIKVLSE